jgi:hypothetical protein
MSGDYYLILKSYSLSFINEAKRFVLIPSKLKILLERSVFDGLPASKPYT